MTDRKTKIRVVITSGYRWSYFEWFLLGFRNLKKQGLIDIKYQLPIGSWLLMHANSKLWSKVIRKIISYTEKDSYNLEGYILLPDGTKKFFCIDSADSPFLFKKDDLDNVNVYFKMQCPIDINAKDFELTQGVHIPWCDHSHENLTLDLTDQGERKKISTLMPYKRKIKPLMIGPRQLSNGCSYRALKRGYKNYLVAQTFEKTKKIMCYFGNAAGPGETTNVKNPDFDWEKDIMGFYKGKVSHPNEKRKRVSEYIAKQSNSDARIISQGNSDSKARQNKKLIIPLSKFCKHISKFQYNMNVSGYRLSIPNRFIESFMVGTTIFTDKLHVKWYRPFDCEVRETVDMGYLPMNQVNWKKFENDLNNLPKSDPKQVIEAFNKKWAPDVVARYIIDTVAKS